MRKSTEEMHARGRQQEASGQSVAEFCRQKRLSEKKYYIWRQRVKRPDRFATVKVLAKEVATSHEQLTGKSSRRI